MEPPTGYSDFNYSPARRPYNKRNIVYRRYILAENEGGETTTEINAVKLHRMKPPSPQGTPRKMKESVIKTSSKFL